MRRRESINVWPAIADLMTVLAVPAICVAIGGLPFFDVDAGPGKVTPKNDAMFKAIQEAQDFVSVVERNSHLQFERDQSLRFGEDLVTFDRSATEVRWNHDGAARLRRYCQSITQALNSMRQMQGFFLIQVEGHADPTTCSGNADCNWRYSSARAATFLIQMRSPDLCPQSAGWTLLPVGFAATRPIPGGDAAARRIALRLLPDYARIIERVLHESLSHGAAAGQPTGPVPGAPSIQPTP